MKSMKKTMYLVHGAVIAALYVVLTYLAAGFDLASGAIQVRFSEALTVLPFFTPAAIPGLSIGCLLANLTLGSPLPDIIFGTLATLIGAVGTYLLRKNRFLAPVPPILSNAIIIPFVLKFAYVDVEGSIPFLMLTVGAGELIAAGIFGLILLHVLLPLRHRLFGD
ncbi:MAG: QueT transporter family protein [Lachnospiraceae bacterium]|nr:QueT transporter family protein [Lachnospiraceae bacterium]